ncbi:MAG TPA: helix-turn-helix domain-containing protein [Pilimelia sp.]|nr:helix-turn-helix domain-containing protein [Pilimelia sp.]
MGGSNGSTVVRAAEVVTALEVAVSAANAVAAELRLALATQQLETAAMYGVPEAAERMRIGERTLRRMIADGEIDTVRIGRRRLIPREVVDAYAKPAA